MNAERLLADSLTNPVAACAAGVDRAVCHVRFCRTRHVLQAPATHERRQGWNQSHIIMKAEGSEQ